MKKAVVTLALLALAVPLTAQAATFLSDENLRETTEATAGDLFIAASTVAVLHDVRDDLFAAGENVSVNADIGGDVMAAGNIVRVNGRVKDDVMAAGSDVLIRAAGVDDVMAAAASLEIIEAEVAGSVYAAGENVRISGTVAGDVRAAGANVVIASGTRIGGDLLTLGEREPTVEDNVTIGGTREHQRVEHDTGWDARFSVADWVRSVLTWFITGMVLLYLLRGAATEIVAQAIARSGRSLGIGALAIVFVLPATLLLAITIVGLPLAALILFLTCAHLIVAHALAALLVGSWLMTRFGKPAEAASALRWQHVLLGAVVLKLIGLVPVVGDVAVLILTLAAWGALLTVLWPRLRGRTPVARPAE